MQYLSLFLTGMLQITTDQQYDHVVAVCREIFTNKTNDYGTSWRVYRPISIADQIYIKAKRIRNIQEKRIQKVLDDARGEFTGIFNYAIIGLIQLELPRENPEELNPQEAIIFYDEKKAVVKNLMENKNHDYGEAWRDMAQESFTDLILAKVLRIKQIIKNDGKTAISEGIDSNYIDIANYAAFALILSEETTKLQV